MREGDEERLNYREAGGGGGGGGGWGEEEERRTEDHRLDPYS